MNNIKLNDILQDILAEAAEEKTYEVEYWYRYGKYGDDKDSITIEVKATSEEEAIEKAKEKAKKLAIRSSFEAKEKK